MAASPIFMDRPSFLDGSAHSQQSINPSNSFCPPLVFDDDAWHSTSTTTFLQEDETCYLLSVEMPGVNGKNDLEISLVDNHLIIGGYSRRGCSSNSSQARKRQRIRRTLQVDPQAIDVDRAIARVWNGCLTLYAPKRNNRASVSSSIIMADDQEDCYGEDTVSSSTSSSSSEWDHLYNF